MPDHTVPPAEPPVHGVLTSDSEIVVEVVTGVGVAGPPGPTGPTGPPNVLTIGTVDEGTPADATITGTSPAQILNLTLPLGPPGVDGADGADGADGVDGAPGPTGPQGDVGPAGPQGPIGPQGPQGIQGPQGATGASGAGGDHGALSGLGDDDHPQYLNNARGDVRYAPIGGGGGGVSDHGALTGLADDDHPQYMLKDKSSGPGVIAGGILSDGGGGTVNVTAGTGYLRNADSPTVPVVEVAWPAVVGQVLTDNVPHYVYLDYNAGSPVLTFSPTLFGRYDRIIVGIVMRSGTAVYITQGTIPAGNVSRAISRLEFLTYGAHRATGLVTTETGTRNLSNSDGHVFTGLNEYVLGAKNSASGDTFATYYRNGSGGWTTVAAQTQWNNTQYDDGSGTLVTMASGRHGVHWIFRTVDGGFHSLYGQSDYTLAQAQAAPLPANRPPHLQSWHAVFCAKLIFQRGAATATQIDIAFTSNIGAGAASDHGALGGLADDDHPQYLTVARADVLYAPVGGGGGGGVGADPSASIGLTAINGAAATFMRSDAAPALSQAIAPTWTQAHTFTVGATGLLGSVHLLSTQPGIAWRNTAAAADNKMWLASVSGVNWKLAVFNDAGGASLDAINVARSGIASVTITMGGAVSGPSFNATSARALKRETGRVRSASDILARLRPILYRLLADETHEQIGLIAEEVHAVCPQLSDGTSVAYDRLALLLLADWQERRAADAEG